MTLKKGSWFIISILVAVAMVSSLIGSVLTSQKACLAIGIGSVLTSQEACLGIGQGMPHLVADITFPADNARIEKCTYFTVSATITNTGSGPSCSDTATIDIAHPGFASLFNSNEVQNCGDLGPGESVTVSWTVHCDAPSLVVITVTPAGYQHGQPNGNGCDIAISPTHLESDSITIIQFQSQPAPRRPSWSWARPADITTKYFQIDQQAVNAGQPVTILTNAVNNGDTAGEYNVVLKVNGKIEQTKRVTVEPGIALPVRFTVTKNQPGTYTVDIDGKKGSFDVLSAGSGSAGSSPSSALIIVVILGLLVIATVVVLMLAFRRPA